MANFCKNQKNNEDEHFMKFTNLMNTFDANMLMPNELFNENILILISLIN